MILEILNNEQEVLRFQMELETQGKKSTERCTEKIKSVLSVLEKKPFLFLDNFSLDQISHFWRKHGTA